MNSGASEGKTGRAKRKMAQTRDLRRKPAEDFVEAIVGLVGALGLVRELGSAIEREELASFRASSSTAGRDAYLVRASIRKWEKTD